MKSITVSELTALMVKTFKAIANFDSSEYITDEVATDEPAADLFSLMNYFDHLKGVYDTVTLFPANTRDEMLNAFFVADVNAIGLDAAIVAYNNGDLPTFTPPPA